MVHSAEHFAFHLGGSVKPHSYNADSRRGELPKKLRAQVDGLLESEALILPAFKQPSKPRVLQNDRRVNAHRVRLERDELPAGVPHGVLAVAVKPGHHL